MASTDSASLHPHQSRTAGLTPSPSGHPDRLWPCQGHSRLRAHKTRYLVDDTVTLDRFKSACRYSSILARATSIPLPPRRMAFSIHGLPSNPGEASPWNFHLAFSSADSMLYL